MILSLLLLACGSSEPAVVVPPVDSAEATSAATAVLCQAASNIGLACTATEAAVQVGEHQIGLRMGVAEFISLEGTSIGMGSTAQKLPSEAQLVAEFHTSVNGQPLGTLRMSHAASDPDPNLARNKVLDEMVQRWMVGYGMAILDSLGTGEATPGLAAVGLSVPAQTVGAYRMTTAYPMLKGQGIDPNRAGNVDSVAKTLLGAVGPFLESAAPTAPHTVRVQAKLGGGGAPGKCGIVPPLAMTDGATASIVPFSGEVQVDGVAVGDICDLSQSVNWPLPQGGAMLEWEQFLVAMPTPDAAAAAAP